MDQSVNRSYYVVRTRRPHTFIDACGLGNVDAAKQMISNDVNMAYSDGQTPLYIASARGHLEIVKMLIASGALLDIADKLGSTHLYSASKNGHLEIVKMLIASGALLDEANNNGWTPLYIASENGHLEIV